MKTIKFFSLLIITFLVIDGLNAQFSKNPLESYSLVKISINSNEDIMRLQMNDITVEHYRGNLKSGIELVINQEEISRLANTGLNYEIKIKDLDSYYRNRIKSSPTDLQKSINILNQDNISGFSYGSMGGYYTYDEMVQKLDSMRIIYPNLISVKQNLGFSNEGRAIWAVRISDNPGINESETEAPVYFDALHHAREPQAMACLMYYMYWLLDNYGTDPEATYLVNNRQIYFVPIANPDG